MEMCSCRTKTGEGIWLCSIRTVCGVYVCHCHLPLGLLPPFLLVERVLHTPPFCVVFLGFATLARYFLMV